MDAAVETYDFECSEHAWLEHVHVSECASATVDMYDFERIEHVQLQ